MNSSEPWEDQIYQAYLNGRMTPDGLAVQDLLEMARGKTCPCSAKALAMAIGHRGRGQEILSRADLNAHVKASLVDGDIAPSVYALYLWGCTCPKAFRPDQGGELSLYEAIALTLGVHEKGTIMGARMLSFTIKRLLGETNE